ncbi:hypothetical protein Mmc1_2374 [Magnetococcus marinus MC-1]|uniref:Uncharacterized protein n=1 Tax=Magnetococcus marinus (strain ATCC BAA-1437 / JCM 17883 / MC-1) TaxID=156889 RepID=A0LA81_MAGMM|nr:hypothetical protein [Magnetococcus marinus]ABK44874.1 hypothetical protein Mmc1_2374 [Magnetococcus marinus MC-1]
MSNTENRSNDNEAVFQINIAYSAEEDRLLLRLNDAHSHEYRFWITRHLIIRVWPALLKFLRQFSTGTATALTPEAEEMMLDFAQQSANEKVDFERQYRADASTLPLGDAPILVHTITFTPKEKLLELSLRPKVGLGMTVNMDVTLLHAVCKLILTRVNQVDWGVTFSLKDEPYQPQPDSPPRSTPPSLPPAPGSGQLH